MKNIISKKALIAIISGIAVVAVLIVLLVTKPWNSDDKTNKQDTIPDRTDQSGTIENSEKVIDTQPADNKPTEPPVVSESSNKDKSSENTSKQDESMVLKLGEYKGIKADYKPEVITDETVEAALQKLLKDNIEIINLPDRAFEQGDMAIVIYEAFVDGKAIEELSGAYLQVNIGSGIMTETIENEIVGKRIGDRFTVNMDYPENYTSIPEVAGKTVEFTIDLVDGFAYKLPELNDAFIRDVTTYNSVDEYRIQEKERLQNEANEDASEQRLLEIKKSIVEDSVFSDKVNTDIKKRYLARLQENDSKYESEYMMDASTYYMLTYNMTLEEYQKSVMDEVSLEVKFEYILDEIAQKENIVDSTDENERREKALQLILDNTIKNE